MRETVRRDVTEYPFVFYPVGLNVRGRKVVIIGDDREADEKTEALHEVGADVVVFRDAALVRDEDVCDAFFVISTPQDEPFSLRMRALADEHKFLLCCIDQPLQGFVAMQAIVKSGPVRIAISTGGIAPRVGKFLKFAFEGAMDAKFKRFIDCINAQRERNRVTYKTSAQRRSVMIAAAEGFAVDLRFRYPQWFEDELAGMLPQVVAPGAHAAPTLAPPSPPRDAAATRARYLRLGFAIYDFFRSAR